VKESPHLAPITRTTVTDEIVKRLVNLILDEGLKPGDKLPPERELMVRLSVGRSSLREAIKTLSAVGVVEVSVGEGMFVGRGDTSVLTKPLSWGLLMGERSTREVIEARHVVEIELAGLAALRGTDEEIEAIKERLLAMHEVFEDADSYSRADLEFHLAVAEAAHNRVLYQVLDTLRHIVRVWIARVHIGHASTGQSIAEHDAIYEAIRAHDEDAARKAMEKHLDRASALLEEMISANQQERAGVAEQTAGSSA
jgi:GntR family transcriptional regulator, transcriptional repressor for pyruvate dehydrogenase complex